MQAIQAPRDPLSKSVLGQVLKLNYPAHKVEGAIVVTVPQAFLDRFPQAEHEQICIRVMRKRGIPINGSHCITGLRFGFLLSERDDSNNLVFTFYRKDPRTESERLGESRNVLEPA